MKTLSLIEMENVAGGRVSPITKCRIGLSIGCGFVGLAFGLATGPFGGILAAQACSLSGIFSGYCD